MNDTAEDLGLAQTYFVNETGLDTSPTAAGAYGSAWDIAELLGAVFERAPGILEATSKAETTYHSLGGTSHLASNTNISATETAGLIASKTGFTDLAGGR
jgi:D-alanyl-D-alanine carboxypeptidase